MNDTCLKNVPWDGLGRRILLTMGALVFTLLGVARADVVAPGAYTNAPGEYEVAGGAGGRYQQIFAASEFWPAGETHTISAVSWRLGEALPPATYAWSIPNVDVYMWSTPRAVDAMSDIFADNYAEATNRTHVYSGPISFSGTVTANVPNPFNITIPLQVPFNYDPAQGNLVFEFIAYDNYANIWDRQVDLVAASTVTNYTWGSSAYPDGTVQGFSGAGLVTQFSTDYIPVLPGDPVYPTGLLLTPDVVLGGESSIATLDLSGPAPAGGMAVALFSNDASASVPASVTVAEGATSASFVISTSQVPADTIVTIDAQVNGGMASANLSILAPPPVYPASVTLSPTSVTGGSSATGTVNLNGPAPVGGILVGLQSSSASATVPALIAVPAGATKATFTISTKAVSSTTIANITAAANGNSASASLTINVPVAPPAGGTGRVDTLEINPCSLKGGTAATGKVSIMDKAPAGGVTVALTSSNPGVVKVPATVFIPAGSKAVSFQITTSKVTVSTNVTVTAKSGSTQKSKVMTVKP